jgi:hypothetical protein
MSCFGRFSFSRGPIWTKFGGNQPDASPGVSIYPGNPYSCKKTTKIRKNETKKFTKIT